MESVSIHIHSCVRGHHISQEFWSPIIGEQFYYEVEEDNAHDPYAVAIIGDNYRVLGHVPRIISAACSLFLRKNGRIRCDISGARHHSADLPQGGLEVPCILMFYGEETLVEKVRRLLLPPATSISSPHTQKIQSAVFSGAHTDRQDSPAMSMSLPHTQEIQSAVLSEAHMDTQDSPAMSISSPNTQEIQSVVFSEAHTDRQDSPVVPSSSHRQDTQDVASVVSRSIAAAVSTSIKPQEISTSKQHMEQKQAVVLSDDDDDTHLDATPQDWLSFKRCFLSSDDRQIILGGEMLNDKHISFAQALLKNQFSRIGGLASTLQLSHRKISHTGVANIIQIVHTRGDHWIVATTVGSKDSGTVLIYDTLYEKLDGETERLLQHIFGKSSQLQMSITPRQEGYKDCGIFAIVIATSLACFGSLPPSPFIQSCMREHLLTCFENFNLSPFPVEYI